MEDKMMKYYLDEYKCEYCKKSNLNIHYTDDSVLNYLYYWYKYWIIFEGKDNVELDKLWKLDEQNNFDGNKDNYEKINKLCKNKDIHIDTMFSLWMPLKMMLQCLCEDIYHNKGIRYAPSKKSITDYEIIIKNELYKKDDELYQIMKKVFSLSSEKCNVFNYPYVEGKINFNSSRGQRYYDQIPITLKQCLCDDGIYRDLFVDYSFEQWIKYENLSMLFDGDIKLDCIKNIGPLSKEKCKWLTTKRDLLELFKDYQDILTKRKNRD